MLHAPTWVRMFDRRTHGGKPLLDRRKTYVDVIERVLGSSFPSGDLEHAHTFSFSQVGLGGTVALATTSTVEVTVLNRMRKRKG